MQDIKGRAASLFISHRHRSTSHVAAIRGGGPEASAEAHGLGADGSTSRDLAQAGTATAGSRRRRRSAAHPRSW